MDFTMNNYIMSVVISFVMLMLDTSDDEDFSDKSSLILIKLVSSLIPFLNLLLFLMSFGGISHDNPRYKSYFEFAFVVGSSFLIAYFFTSLDWTLYASIGIFMGIPVYVKLKSKGKDEYYYME